MEPVSVVASEYILSQLFDIQYPPEAAYPPYDAMRGFTSASLSSSCLIFSDAITLPPGELTLSTTALTVESARTLDIIDAKRLPSTSEPEPPSTISPSAYITAISLSDLTTGALAAT